MSAERIEAQLTVPASTSVSASNSGGGPTTVTATAQATYPTSLMADLSTQLNATRAPTSGSWTVGLVNGQVLIDCDHTTTATPSFSVSWTSTALRDVLGFTRDIDYAQTAAQIAADVGYGTWTAGWLCNEASGSLAAVFGAPSLTATSTPTYSNGGPRGGSDKAVGFDSVLDAFDAGDTFDVTATSDLCIAFVGKWSAAGNADLFSKITGTTGWRLTAEATAIRFWIGDGTHSAASDTSAFVALNTWYVGIAAIDRAANTMRFGIRTLGASPVIDVGASADASTVGNLSNAVSAVLGACAGHLGTGVGHQVAALYIGTGVGCAAGLPANLSTALVNFGGAFGSWTGTEQMRGIWIPSCPIALDGDPLVAPKSDDGRTTVSPAGDVYRLVGNKPYRHRNVHFSHVPNNLVWVAQETTTNASWERWYLDTQNGEHSWFAVGARVKVYWDKKGTATELGNGTVASWQMPQPARLDEIRISAGVPAGYTGLFEVRLGDLWSSG